MAGNTLLDEFRKLRSKAGVPPIGRVHDLRLRHLAGSLMLANGDPITTDAAILGHSPKALLTTYAHAIPKHVVQAPRNIAEVLPYEPAAARSTPTPAPPIDDRSLVRRRRTPTGAPAVYPAVPIAAAPPGANLDVLLADR